MTITTRTRARAAAALAVALACAATNAPPYRLLKTVTLGGEGGWDYLVVDPEARRLYIARDTRVQVLDADTLKPVGDIAGVDGAHGVALAPELGRGFATAGRADRVVIFDLKTLKVLKNVKTGRKPDAVVYEPATRRVLAFDGDGREATVIDAVGGGVVATLPLGGKPEFAVADGRGTVYVNSEDTSELLALDVKTPKVRSRFPLKPCLEPTGLALDAAHYRLFSVCGNQTMAVVDAASGTIIATPPIGARPDAAAFDAAGRALSSNGGGTLTVVARGADGRWSSVQTVATRRGARTMALDPKTGRLFLVTADFGPAPAPTPAQPRPRPRMIPGTFVLLVYGS